MTADVSETQVLKKDSSSTLRLCHATGPDAATCLNTCLSVRDTELGPPPPQHAAQSVVTTAVQCEHTCHEMGPHVKQHLFISSVAATRENKGANCPLRQLHYRGFATYRTERPSIRLGAKRETLRHAGRTSEGRRPSTSLCRDEAGPCNPPTHTLHSTAVARLVKQGTQIRHDCRRRWFAR
jgi:hypothetical protein